MTADSRLSEDEFLRRYCAESSGRDLIINALERNAQTKEGGQ